MKRWRRCTAARCWTACGARDLSGQLLTFPAGEAHKTPETWLSLCRQLAQEGFTRSDGLLALGGGVTGDMAGFVAACYQRGMALAQLPTTLLSQVDSAVGGKTAVDLPEGKNLLGAFYQPRLVIADPDCLTTLPRRELRCGMAEVIKYGFIQDAGLLDELETDTPNWTAIIARCLTIRAALVARRRAGHRGAAAAELRPHLWPRLRGGGRLRRLHPRRGGAAGGGHAAVAAPARGDGVQAAYDRLLALLERWELPCTMPFDTETVSRYLARDKKCEGDTLHAVLLWAIGDAYVEDVPLAALQEGLA